MTTLSQDQLRNKLARDRGYQNYHDAHDAARQDIDNEVEWEIRMAGEAIA